MQNTELIKKLRPILILVITFFVLLLAIFWVYGHAFLEITVQGKPTGTVTYILKNQDTGKVTNFESDDTKVRRIVASGNYEINVLTAKSSYVTTQMTGRYLSTSNVMARPVAQLDREAVGYNPAPCTIYLGGILRSHECGTPLNSVSVHVPASANQPTYTQLAGIQEETDINGVAYTRLGPVIFTEPKYVTEEIVSQDYQVGLLNNDLSISSRINIDYLALGQDYQIKAYLDGFIIYSDDLLDVYYYSSLNATPIKLNIDSPVESTQRAIGLTVSGSAIVRYFSNNLGGEEEAEETTSEEVLSEIYIYSGEKNIKYTTTDFLLGASVCTENRLCILSGDSVLNIYSTTEKELKKIYRYTNVKELHQIETETYFINKNGIVSFNGLTGNGHYVYTFGGYQYCGLQQSSNGSIACLIDLKQNKLALNLIAGSTVDSVIDKQVYKLSTYEGIDNVSLYKNILYVTPRVSVNNDEVTLSQDQIDRGKRNLQKALNDSRLETSSLTIINTANPF